MSNYRKTMADALREMYPINEDTVELDEAKYELYHKDFSSAMQHAYHVAKKHHGITIDPEEIDNKVATGPRKPSEGKTNTYRLKGDKGAVQIQVYNKGGSKPFELNMYKEEVELDESVIDKVKEIASKKSAAKIDGVVVDSFTASAISQIYDKVNDANKKKMDSLPITKLANLAMKMMQKNEFVPEEVDLDEDASNFKSAVARIKKAKSAKDLKKLEKSFERVYKQTDALTDKEFGQLDDMISDKLVKLGEEVEEADEVEEDAIDEEAVEVEEDAIDEEAVEETVAVPVQALEELMRLAGYENYEAKIDEYENAPEPEYMDAEEQLIGLSGGLNGPKKAYAASAGGDNAMAQEPREVEETIEESFYSDYSKMVEELKAEDE